MPDIARLDRLRNHLREHPDEHNQRRFACGTTACAAGWAIALEHNSYAGANVEGLLYTDTMLEAAVIYGEGFDFSFLGSSVEPYFWYARMLLGLTENEAEALFFRTMNSPTGALKIIDALINREKGELTEEDRKILEYYALPTEPSEEV
jgi:hypothetical protein